jgi:hypothetical protein
MGQAVYSAHHRVLVILRSLIGVAPPMVLSNVCYHYLLLTSTPIYTLMKTHISGNIKGEDKMDILAG